MSTIAVNTITDASGGTTATINGYTPTVSNMAGRNRIINGAMGVWQRGTSFTGITNVPSYTADRWGAFVSAVIAGEQVIQSSSTPSGQGFKYSAGFGRTAANTNTNSIWFVQLIESVNMLDLAGQSVTLSFWAKAGANYSGGNLTVLVNSGTSADQSLATFSGGPCTGYTGYASVINGSQAITTTWTKYTFTGSVGSTAQEIGVAFGYTPTGTAGADDNIYITGVQLEKGSVATPFDYRQYGTELALCQRYYWQLSSSDKGGYVNGIIYQGWADTATSSIGIAQFPVTMRTSPTLSTSGTIGDYVFRAPQSQGTSPACSAVPTLATSGTNYARIGASTSGTFTVGAGHYFSFSSNTTGYVGFSSEL